MGLSLQMTYLRTICWEYISLRGISRLQCRPAYLTARSHHVVVTKVPKFRMPKILLHCTLLSDRTQYNAFFQSFKKGLWRLAFLDLNKQEMKILTVVN